MTLTEFQKKVYTVASTVPKGKVTTYSAIAYALGTMAYRAVGSALNNHPPHLKTPCHRVVNANGYIGGWQGNNAEKVRRLEAEGIKIKDGKIVDFEKIVIKSFY